MGGGWVNGKAGAGVGLEGKEGSGSGCVEVMWAKWCWVKLSSLSWAGLGGVGCHGEGEWGRIGKYHRCDGALTRARRLSLPRHYLLALQRCTTISDVSMATVAGAFDTNNDGYEKVDMMRVLSASLNYIIQDENHQVRGRAG